MVANDKVRDAWIAETKQAEVRLGVILSDIDAAYYRLMEWGTKWFLFTRKPNVAQPLVDAVQKIHDLLNMRVVRESPDSITHLRRVADELASLAQQPVNESTRNTLLNAIEQKKREYYDAVAVLRTKLVKLRKTLDATGSVRAA